MPSPATRILPFAAIGVAKWRTGPRVWAPLEAKRGPRDQIPSMKAIVPFSPLRPDDRVVRIVAHGDGWRAYPPARDAPRRLHVVLRVGIQADGNEVVEGATIGRQRGSRLPTASYQAFTTM